MTKQHTTSATEAFEAVTSQIQSMFNPQAGQDVFKAFGQISERMTAIAVEAGTRSTEIMSSSTKEMLSNLSGIAQTHNEPAEYGKAYRDIAQKQADLMKRTAQAASELAQKSGADIVELATKAGAEAADKAKSARTAA